MARRKKVLVGAGLLDTLKSLHNKLKEGKYISRGLNALNTVMPNAAIGHAHNLAAELGYGKRRKRKARKLMLI